MEGQKYIPVNMRFGTWGAGKKAISYPLAESETRRKHHARAQAVCFFEVTWPDLIDQSHMSNIRVEKHKASLVGKLQSLAQREKRSENKGAPDRGAAQGHGYLVLGDLHRSNCQCKDDGSMIGQCLVAMVGLMQRAVRANLPREGKGRQAAATLRIPSIGNHTSMLKNASSSDRRMRHQDDAATEPKLLVANQAPVPREATPSPPPRSGRLVPAPPNRRLYQKQATGAVAGH